MSEPRLAVLPRLRDWLRAAPPAGVLAVAFGLMTVYAFPGQLSYDSLDHLREARTRIYTDSHPPAIAKLFRLCDLVVAGPFGMLVLQNALLLLGLYAIFRAVFAPRKAAWVAAALYLSPPVLPVMAVIWKDSMMAGLLATGFAGLLSARRSRNVLGVLALGCATAMRYNAFGATLPMVVLLFRWHPLARGVSRYGVATLAWLAITIGAFAVNAKFTDKPMHYWQSSLAIFDIVGIYVNVEGTLPDARLKEELAGTQLLVDHDIHAAMRHVYSPTQFFSILYDRQYALWDLPIIGTEPAPQAQRDAISRAFWHAVKAYPWQYIEHRLDATAAVLAFGEPRMSGAVNKRPPRNAEYQAEFGISTKYSRTQARLTRAYYYIMEYTPLSAPWLYVLVSLALLPLAWRQRDALALLLSGLVMESSLLFLAHSVDYRYSHWLSISTAIGAIFALTRLRRDHRQRAAAAAPPAPDAIGTPAA
jgi:hypothetical protein